MARVDGVNKAKIDAVPSTKINPGDQGGRMHVLYEEYVFDANVFALGDFIDTNLDVPAGARIIDAAIMSDQLGTTGIFELGSASNPDSLVVGADAGGQAVLTKATIAAADLGVELTEKTNFALKCTEATDAALGDKIRAWIVYVL